MVQTQREEVCEESKEISDARREGGDKAQEESLREVGQPYFVQQDGRTNQAEHVAVTKRQDKRWS